MAIDVLRSKGVPEEHILFLNLIASPEGAANFAAKFPRVRIVTAFVDQGLDEKKYEPFRSHFYSPANFTVVILSLDSAILAIDFTLCEKDRRGCISN